MPISRCDFPEYFQIETVATCNARCVMCPVEEWKRDALLISDDFFAHLVEQLAQHKDTIRQVTPQLDGEPLIDKKLESRIAMLKQAGIAHVDISSNASLLTEERARQLLDCGLDRISFSIDGATKETFEAIRVRLNFEECRDNVLNLIALRNRTGSKLSIRVRMTIQEGNHAEYPSFLDFWRRHLGPQDRVYGKYVHNWANWLPGYVVPDGIDRDRLNASACSSPFNSMVVLCDGRVPLCCSDFNASVLLGNAKQSSLQEIWLGPAAENVRRIHRDEGRRGMSMCVDCNVWDEEAKAGG